VNLGKYSNSTICGGRRRRRRIGFKFEINFTEIASAEWDFRFGVDFGGGGVVAMDDTVMKSYSGGMWWAYRRNRATQLNYKQTLAAGAHKMEI
jgi:hypothetical protein